ncbi:MAG: hypothetical protein IKO85_05100 [Bacteroidaceae bacterium]|nr:hypothetical protein [Bacteroidaceae bacterium]
MTATKENTLYLPIKQVFFDQIINGTKLTEEREVKFGITASRYLMHDGNGELVLNPSCTEEDEEYYLDDYNGGKFPFLPKPFKFLQLAVGYHKVRDEALVEVKDITFKTGRVLGQPPKFAWWIIEFHIGRIINVQRKRVHP